MQFAEAPEPPPVEVIGEEVTELTDNAAEAVSEETTGAMTARTNAITKVNLLKNTGGV